MSRFSIPVDTIKNANTVTTTTLSTDDTLNSNDAWQRNSQTGNWYENFSYSND